MEVRWTWNNFLKLLRHTEKVQDLVRRWKNSRAWKQTSWRQIKLWPKIYSTERRSWLLQNISREEVKSNNNCGIMNSLNLIQMRTGTLLHMILLIAFLFTSHSIISKSILTISIKMIINTCTRRKSHLMNLLLSNTSSNRNISLSTKFWLKVKSTRKASEKLLMNLPKKINGARRAVPEFQLHALVHSCVQWIWTEITFWTRMRSLAFFHERRILDQEVLWRRAKSDQTRRNTS